MRRRFSRKDTTNLQGNEDTNYSLGDLDLVNLKLNIPTDFPKTGFVEKGSGDTYISHSSCCKSHREQYRIRTPVKKTKSPSRSAQCCPHDPSGHEQKTYHQGSRENLVFLCSQREDRRIVTSEPIKEGDFLYPTKKKSNFCNQVDTAESKLNFPFKLTPSGNLKVQSSQVVFSSKKLSVLVADPKNTKVNITSDRFRRLSPRKNMSSFDTTLTKKPTVHPMEALMKQTGGLSNLGSLLGQCPIRSPLKESSEYECKPTNDILDPELNLSRLGLTSGEVINWDKVKLPEKQNLYMELYQRITSNTNADCKVYCEGLEFSCHLIVLQCYSELFNTYVAVKRVELPADNCTARAFGFIYNWMITGEPSYNKLDRENVLDIFASAKYLQIKDLVEQCWAFIDNTDVFNEGTAFLLYHEAKERQVDEVKELMLPRIKDFFLMLVSSQNWLDLDVDDIKNFLNSNYITVNCEMEVFMSAVRWLKYDWTNREKYKYEVLECIRFGNVAPWQLVDIKRNPESPDFIELSKDTKICKMIDDGLAYVIIKYWYGHENQDVRNWNKLLGLQEPAGRNWTGAEKHYMTYREFLIYLDQHRRNHLIEKNKMKMGDKGEKRSGEGKDLSQKSIPRVPTMEEFLAKRKPAGHKKINKVTS